MEALFETLRTELSTAPVFSCPDVFKHVVLETDISDFALGIVLSEDSKLQFQPVQFVSRKINKAIIVDTPSVKKVLAMDFTLKKFRVYLLSDEKLTMISDHQAFRTAF